MAARSLYLSLFRNAVKEKRSLLQSFSSMSEIVSPNDEKDRDNGAPDGRTDDDLKSRLFRLRLPKRSATTVLQNWVTEGHNVTISELRHISKELRKSQRYKHALEISEWMVAHEEFDISDSDYAVRVDLMSKVFGIEAAERYFEALPSSAKTSETYTALLHSYAASKQIEKAENLFERIKEANLSLNALTYNELMTLYMSLGQHEKVSFIINDLKSQNIEPDLFTYNLWISSRAAALDINEVKLILDEMSSLKSPLDENWLRYTNLVKIYMNSGNLRESNFTSLVENDKAITQREWITYDFLIILYGGLGNKDKIDQIWKSLRLMKQKLIGRNYACIISAYLILGHLKEVGEIIDQWKQLATSEFDDSICNRVLKGFVEVGLFERACDLRTLLMEKGCNNIEEDLQ